MRAFVVGYTGETGKALLKSFIEVGREKFTTITLIGRREVNFENPNYNIFDQKVINFDKISEDHVQDFSGFDVGFCCLGTTRGKAGSAEAFRKVDFDYAYNVALAAKEGGTKHFHLVSSYGANKKSSTLYASTKGEIEAACENLGFERCSIYQPRMLYVEGGRQERRIGERIGMCLFSCLFCCCWKQAFTPVTVLSRSMIENTLNTTVTGNEILGNNQIYELGEKSD